MVMFVILKIRYMGERVEQSGWRKWCSSRKVTPRVSTAGRAAQAGALTHGPTPVTRGSKLIHHAGNTASLFLKTRVTPEEPLFCFSRQNNPAKPWQHTPTYKYIEKQSLCSSQVQIITQLSPDTHFISKLCYNFFWEVKLREGQISTKSLYQYQGFSCF